MVVARKTPRASSVSCIGNPVPGSWEFAPGEPPSWVLRAPFVSSKKVSVASSILHIACTM